MSRAFDRAHSTTVSPSTCHRCGASLLVAYDDGLRARVDAMPITRAQEVGDIAAGRWTYTRTRGGRLYLRDASRIDEPLRAGEAIHVDHDCPIRRHRR